MPQYLKMSATRRLMIVVLAWVTFPMCSATSAGDELSKAVRATLDVAGTNRPQLEAALAGVPADHRPGLEFLLAHMPQRDATSLTAEFLLENVELAYRARDEAPWGRDIPDEIFLNDVLPYANINERRDNWRREMRERCLPLIAGAGSPGEAAALLNQKIFPLLNVKYSTRRNRADQGPLESMTSGLASCTGLSILLIDACRSVGIPARFVGTPLWSDGSGNHSWVEVWDRGWHFTGAAEPTGMELDRAWFTARAGKATSEDPRHAIYAVSFRRTPIHFPLVWDRSITSVSAVDVTTRYTEAVPPLSEGAAHVMFVCRGPDDQRVSAELQITNVRGDTVFSGTTRDERFDRNDHLTAALKRNHTYVAVFGCNGNRVQLTFKPDGDDTLIEAECP